MITLSAIARRCAAVASLPVMSEEQLWAHMYRHDKQRDVTKRVCAELLRRATKHNMLKLGNVTALLLHLADTLAVPPSVLSYLKLVDRDSLPLLRSWLQRTSFLKLLSAVVIAESEGVDEQTLKVMLSGYSTMPAELQARVAALLQGPTARGISVMCVGPQVVETLARVYVRGRAAGSAQTPVCLADLCLDALRRLVLHDCPRAAAGWMQQTAGETKDPRSASVCEVARVIVSNMCNFSKWVWKEMETALAQDAWAANW